MAFIEKSDQIMSSENFEVYISRQVYQSMGAKDARNLAKETDKFAGMLAKHLDVPKDMKIRICGIKKRSVKGSYFNYTKVVALDARMDDWSGYLDTLAHEMTHAEQYKDGRLSREESGTFKHIWKGEKFNNSRSFSKYFNSPWEVEARKFGHELSQLIMAEDGMWENIGIGALVKSPIMLALLEADKDKVPELYEYVIKRLARKTVPAAGAE